MVVLGQEASSGDTRFGSQPRRLQLDIYDGNSAGLRAVQTGEVVLRDLEFDGGPGCTNRILSNRLPEHGFPSSASDFRIPSDRRDCCGAVLDETRILRDVGAGVRGDEGVVAGSDLRSCKPSGL